MQSENVPHFLRFADLQARGIVRTWQGLRYLQHHQGFPPGRLLGPSSRAWTADELNEWLASRPSEPSQQTKERAAKSVKARLANSALSTARQMLDEQDGRAA
jgi:predicted DNA-binding transcriptional regulator AlpA